MFYRRLLGAIALVGVSLTAAFASRSGGAAAQQSRRPDYPFQPVSFTSVHLNDVFWAPRIETNRTVTIPFAFQQCEKTGRVDLFERAAKALKGEELTNKQPPGYPFDDTDVYKVIEGASYTLAVVPDPKLDAYVDSLIAKIAAAQEPDGYIYTTRTINPQSPHQWAGAARWVLERDDSHELYNLGHLFEAAVAHNLATGKKNLLDVATKAADLLVKTFGPGKRTTWPGHQITEMALVRLYRVTGKEEYLSLAKFLLDERGPTPLPPGERANPRGLDYNQAQLKIVDQTEPVGHAVRAMYMYSGMADVAALTGDDAIRKAGDRIWDNLTTGKLYITGGIGSSATGEAFGRPYELPNMSAYNETCASVGMDYWNHRMFLLYGDAKYIDIMERTLYNGLMSGVSLDGKTFFYPNPLESNGQHERSPWFGVACCPSNITRFMASVPGYLYAKAGNTLYVNLYAAGSADIDLNGRKVKVVQETRYPWDGAVKLTVTPDQAAAFAVKVRVPGWARNEPVPSNLYTFVDKSADAATVKVNGQTVSMTLDKGYVTIDRSWKAGDVIEMTLPMPVRRVAANEAVEADRGRVALQRGPIVFTAEWVDNPNGKVRNIVMPDSAGLTSTFRADLLNGVQVIEGRSVGLSYDAAGKVIKQEQPFVAIPYAMWANRGRGQMAVWLARTEGVARPTPFPTIATASTVTTSPSRKDVRNIVDGEEPANSADSSAYFDWWPRRGCKAGTQPAAPGGEGRQPCSQSEWVEMAFAKTATVSTTEVYWFDDTGRGGVRVPQSWKLLYKDGDTWKPVEGGTFGAERNAWNKVTFKPVTTSALRIELTMQPEMSAGLQEWKVK
jgi:DUF1680 family protein